MAELSSGILSKKDWHVYESFASISLDFFLLLLFFFLSLSIVLFSLAFTHEAFAGLVCRIWCRRSFKLFRYLVSCFLPQPAPNFSFNFSSIHAGSILRVLWLIHRCETWVVTIFNSCHVAFGTVVCIDNRISDAFRPLWKRNISAFYTEKLIPSLDNSAYVHWK